MLGQSAARLDAMSGFDRFQDDARPLPTSAVSVAGGVAARASSPEGVGALSIERDTASAGAKKPHDALGTDAEASISGTVVCIWACCCKRLGTKLE